MIDSIQGINGIQLSGKIQGKEDKVQQGTTDSLFVNALNAAKELVYTTNEAEGVSSQLTYDFITGKNESIHGLMIAQEKASVLLQFTMQVRNQTLDAYREIMRMPV
ncbi:MAG: flagellar hook-basal body complex protein FliE [Cellulosilyticaceae bacterium]